MELSGEQRAELDAIYVRAAHPYERAMRSTRDPTDRGPHAKALRKKDRDALVALRKAWDRLRPETQEDVVAHVLRMWEEHDQSQPTPDVGQIADLLEGAMTRPTDHAEEDHPGFGEAAEYLWTLWVERRHGVDIPLSNDVPIDAAARAAIGPELARLFGISAAEAERRLKTALPGRNRAKGRTSPIAGRRRLSKP